MMAKENKVLSEKEIAKKIRDLKIELLRSPTKRGRVKKEIARILTMVRSDVEGGKRKAVRTGATGSNVETKVEGNKA